MIDNYGPPTFFHTFSTSEYDWQDLKNLLCKFNDIENIKSDFVNKLVAMDPIGTSLLIDHKFNAMLAFLSDSNGPFGVVKHYAFKREYQSRGLQHFHMFLWIEDAPVICR